MLFEVVGWVDTRNDVVDGDPEFQIPYGKGKFFGEMGRRILARI